LPVFVTVTDNLAVSTALRGTDPNSPLLSTATSTDQTGADVSTTRDSEGESGKIVPAAVAKPRTATSYRDPPVKPLTVAVRTVSPSDHLTGRVTLPPRLPTSFTVTLPVAGSIALLNWTANDPAGASMTAPAGANHVASGNSDPPLTAIVTGTSITAPDGNSIFSA
jgi:hypothetical protein